MFLLADTTPCQYGKYMNKLIVSIVACFIATLNVCAQQPAGTFSITPKVGVTVSNFSGDMPAEVDFYAPLKSWPDPQISLSEEMLFISGNAYFTESKKKVGFTVGAEAQYQFTKVFGLSFGAFFTQEGVTYKTKGYSNYQKEEVTWDIHDDLSVNLNCITVPVLANVYVWKGLALKAGLQPEFAVGKDAKCDMTFNYDSQTRTLIKDFGPHINTFSLSLPVGISYEYKHFVADFRYCWGLTDVHDKDHKWLGNKKKWNTSSGYNRVMTFTLGYKF